jgi:hypothetical protein
VEVAAMRAIEQKTMAAVVLLMAVRVRKEACRIRIGQLKANPGSEAGNLLQA